MRLFGQRPFLASYALAVVACLGICGQEVPAPKSNIARPSVSQLVIAIRSKANSLKDTHGMREGYESFLSAYKLSGADVRYEDFVTVRLLYEAPRDAGFWNLHWTITDQQPNSDRVWKQWKVVQSPSALKPTAIAECDELSALYAFLVRKAGVHGVGLFWPYPNHTVAAWELHPASGHAVRVVIPTSQIFLDVTDSFGTRKFNPWSQKSIFEYKRQDVPDNFEIPRPLFDLFLRQVDRYAGATDSTLQELRYLREGVFIGKWTPEEAAQDALRRKKDLGSSRREDAAAFWNFAEDMRSRSSP